MHMFSRKGTSTLPEPPHFDEAHYRDLRRRHIIRLLLTYLAPLMLLTGYFVIQYGSIVSESERLHLRAIAESQANTLDLFLSERLVNLSNLINDPAFRFQPSSERLQLYLTHLKLNSEAFVDIGYFDSSGVQTGYAGPFPSLEKRNYSSESWYLTLKERSEQFVITDVYLGFRQRPHFTIAVSRNLEGQFVVLRATLDPERIYEYISSQDESHEVLTAIVNKTGQYQLVPPEVGHPSENAPFVPPEDSRAGVERHSVDGRSVSFGYAWLRGADWALVVQRGSGQQGSFLSGFVLKAIGLSAGVILLIFVIIINRATKLVELQRDSDRTRAQLEHAAKLASVGELAAGIAHEINNPLAVISEGAGLMKDLMSPEFGEPVGYDQLLPHLEDIQESVFRCRDITRKLLGFVRKTDISLKPHDIHALIDNVVDGILGHEMLVANIEIVRSYGKDIPHLVTDGNQLQQVLLNIINNGVDAIEGKKGTITVVTECVDGRVRIALSDTGKGMAPDQLDKIFMPFYTTKEVGKGTGLGLSVSYGIIRSLGGKIEVASRPGQGTTFTIVLPVR